MEHFSKCKPQWTVAYHSIMIDSGNGYQVLIPSSHRWIGWINVSTSTIDRRMGG